MTVDGSSVGHDASYTFLNVRADHTIDATFAINQYTLTPSAGPNGSISPSTAVTVNCGGDQKFDITPADCYHIADVTVDGTSVGHDASYTFLNVRADHTIHATFAINEYTLTPSAGPGGSISPSTSVTVNCGGDQKFDITPADCYHITDVTVDGSSVGHDASYTFLNVRADHTIHAAFAINTYTLTPSAGPGGSISPSTAVTANCGGDQKFDITPADCYHIADVTVDGSSVGHDASYTFLNVRADHTIHAAFAINTYTLTPTAGAGGSISPSTAVTVNCGGDQKFDITPADCYHIADVTVDGSSVGHDASYTFLDVRADHTIHATFAISQYTLTPSAGAGGTISPSTVVTVNCGGDQKFDFTAADCYHIADVTVDGTSVGHDASYTFLNVHADHTIDATFAINTYTLTPSAGAGGSISPNTPVTVNCGGDQKFDITPADCYRIADVTVDGTSVGHDASYTFLNVRADHAIDATFAINQYTLTPSAGPNGSISPSAAVTVNCGEDQKFDITPADCYHIADVTVDGTSVGHDASYTFLNVRADHTIHATFALSQYTLTPSAGAGGTISPSTAVTLNCGSDQKFDITPDGCHVIGDVKVDGTSVGNGSSYTFMNVTANHTIDATFAIKTYTLTPTAGPNGTISPSAVTTVNCGGDQKFDITPNAGYGIDDVKVDGTSVGTPASYTFTDVHANHTIDATFVKTDNTAPTVTVIQPNGGENLVVGMKYKLSWSATDASGDPATVKLWVSRDNGATYVEIDPLVLNKLNTGTYSWTVTGPGTNVDKNPVYSALFKVTCVDNAGNPGEDVSDAPFSIYDFATEVVITRLEAEALPSGIAVKWALSTAHLFTSVALERSEALVGPWNSVPAEIRSEGDLTVATDRTVEAGRTYWYRLVGTTNAGAQYTFGPVSATVSVPAEFALSSVWPNPCRGALRFDFAVPREASLRLTVVDLQGRAVQSLASGTFRPGRYQLSWDGQTDHGRAPAGLYFIRFESGSNKIMRRFSLVP